MKLVTADQMRALEAVAIEQGVTEAQLMENAGVAVAQEAWINMGAAEGRNAVVLVGPGNNGGDGLAAARNLKEWGAEVSVFLLTPRSDDDPQWQALQAEEIEAWSTDEDPDLERLEARLAEAHGVVDALLGTGLSRPIGGVLELVLDKVAERRAQRVFRPHLLSIDVPTGVDPDTGHADPAVVRADTTVALGFAKVGLFAMPGRAIAGDVVETDIGLPEGLGADLPYEDIRQRDLTERMPFRSDDAHKGIFGTTVVAAGSRRYPGAARLASEAALRAGAGLVVLAAPESAQALVAAGTPEVTHHPLPDAGGAVTADAAAELLRAVEGCEALLIGPGLSHTPETAAFVANVLAGLDGVEGLRAVGARRRRAERDRGAARLVRGTRRDARADAAPRRDGATAGHPGRGGAAGSAATRRRLRAAHEQRRGAEGAEHRGRGARWARAALGVLERGTGDSRDGRRACGLHRLADRTRDGPVRRGVCGCLPAQ